MEVNMRYPSDLSDSQWEIIKPFLESNKGKHLQKHDKRELVNAVFYLVKTGCQWNMLPNDFPPRDTVWSFFRRARNSGKWEKIMDALVKKSREQAGRTPEPTYCLVDSQSVKTCYNSEQRGIDGGKKSKGEKDT
jgi:putative transposase